MSIDIRLGRSVDSSESSVTCLSVGTSAMLGILRCSSVASVACLSVIFSRVEFSELIENDASSWVEILGFEIVFVAAAWQTC